MSTENAGIVELPSSKEIVEALLGGNTELAESPASPNTVPYIGNAHPMSQQWPSQSAAGCQEADFYLNEMGSLTLLKPFRYWLLHSSFYRTVVDDALNVLEVYPPQGDKVHRAVEHNLGLFLVLMPNNRIIPARASFRYTRAGTVSKANTAVKQASDPNWVKLSEANALAAQLKAPWMRVIHTGTIASGISKSGERAGKPYKYVNVTSRAVNAEEVKILRENLASEGYVEKMQMAVEAFMTEDQKLASRL